MRGIVHSAFVVMRIVCRILSRRFILIMLAAKSDSSHNALAAGGGWAK
jgi:hypothetical protein